MSWCVVIVFVALAFWLMVAEAAATPGWKIQPAVLPKASGGSSLEAVSCTSPTACMTVGSARGQSSLRMLAEPWNGRRWVIERPPIPLASQTGELTSVSCVSARMCVAVGRGDAWDLVARWNGLRWSTQLLNDFADIIGDDFIALSSVSCTSQTACMAVGSSSLCGGSGCENAAQVRRWDGSRWSSVPIATRRSWFDTSLSGVSCSAASACTAVGYFDITEGCDFGGACIQFPLVERWDGRRWSVQTTRHGGANGVGLSAVSCVSSTACTAVGKFGHGVRAEGWDGSSWSAQTIATVPAAKDTELGSVSCTTSTKCTAVGYATDNAGHRTTLAERSKRGRWSIQPTPDPPGATDSSLSGVSCAATICAAVGRFTNGAVPNPAVGAVDVPLVMRERG